MNTLILKFSYGSYDLANAGTAELEILGNFLSSDFDTDYVRFYSWIDWLYDPKYISTCGNASELAKIDDVIEIYNIFDEEWEGPYFAMNKDKFAKFLHEWRDLVNLQPKTIIVTQHHDGSLTLEGKDFPEWASQ